MTRERENSGELDHTTAQAGYPRGRTAVLVIDPVNDFLSEGGAAWELTKSTVEHNDVVANLRRLISGCRDRGTPVLFGPMAYTEEDYAQDALQKRSGINRIMFEKKMFLAGSWGADFHPDLQPVSGDVILEPHKGTDVFMTDLPGHLERLGTTHLVIAGMTANLCCESTGRHAAERGFDVTYISDAIGAESMPAYEASIRVNYPLVGNAVITVDEFLGALDEAGPADAAVGAGDKVVGSDHGEIGAVQEIVAADNGHEAHMIVRKGLVLGEDVYIPLETVVRKSGDKVFINVPKLVAGKMPWDKPPARSERREMVGPPGVAVDRLYRTYNPTGG